MQALIALYADNKVLFFAAIGLAVLIAVVLLVVLFRLVFGRGVRVAGSARSRQVRLGVVDVHNIDRERQLVLVRRDNIEHLIMIGGPNDLLIESSILRVEARAPREREPAPRVEAGAIAAPPIIAPANAPVLTPIIAAPNTGAAPQRPVAAPVVVQPMQPAGAPVAMQPMQPAGAVPVPRVNEPPSQALPTKSTVSNASRDDIVRALNAALAAPPPVPAKIAPAPDEAKALASAKAEPPVAKPQPAASQPLPLPIPATPATPASASAPPQRGLAAALTQASQRFPALNIMRQPARNEAPASAPAADAAPANAGRPADEPSRLLPGSLAAPPPKPQLNAPVSPPRRAPDEPVPATVPVEVPGTPAALDTLEEEMAKLLGRPPASPR